MSVGLIAEHLLPPPPAGRCKNIMGHSRFLLLAHDLSTQQFGYAETGRASEARCYIVR